MKAVIFIHVLYLILIRTFMVKGVGKCESKVELRAVLLSCPAKDSGCDDDDPLSQAMNAEEAQILQGNSKNFEGSKEDKERGFPNVIKDCKRKLIITLKVKNSGKILCDDEYIVVDHVFDPVTGGKGRLLTPVVLKLQQEQMIQLYGLQFQKVVNSDPFEEQKEADKVCSVSPDSPTCGIAMYDGKPIPFSEGFCCSCDPFVNAKRQLSPVSRGDSFLYRDSKLISEVNSRFVREEKSPNAIYNPELVKLKSANTKSDESKISKSKSTENKGDACSSKFPNFFFELDRKIICGKGDFLRELCKMEKDKTHEDTKTVYSTSSSFNTDIPTHKNKNGFDLGLNINYLNGEGNGDERAGVAPVKNSDSEPPTTDGRIELEKAGGSEPHNEGLSNNKVVFGNLMKKLNSEQTTTAEALLRKKISEMYEHVKSNEVTRGKRENRQEMVVPKSEKKLTLEDKLEEFVKLKHRLTSRRKRLLELPHKRFRKAEIRCRNAEECQATMVKDFPGENYVRAPPPKYFFAHDKFIVDPLEPSQLVANSTCKSADKVKYEEHGVAGPTNCRTSLKIQRRLKEGKSERPVEEAFLEPLQRLQKTEIKPRGKDQLEKGNPAGKLGGKKERVSHNIGGNIENTIRGKIKFQNYGLSHRDKASLLRNDKRMKLAEEREEGETESEEKGKEKSNLSEDVFENAKSHRSRFNAKSIKNLLLKNENEKKTAKPKIRNFFIAKNREKQKFRSEFPNNRKIAGNGDVEKNKLKEKKFDESLEENSKDENTNRGKNENNETEGSKTSSENEKDIKMKLTKVEKKNENAKAHIKNYEENTEKMIRNLKNKKEYGDERNGNFEQSKEDLAEATRKLLQEPPEEKSKNGRSRVRPASHRMDEETDDVDFNMEIIRKHLPGASDSRLYPSDAERYLSSRVNTPQDRIQAEAFDLDAKAGHLKKRPHPLLNLPPQKYYLMENDRHKYPQDFYFVQEARNGPFLEVKNRHFHVKEPERHHYGEPLARDYDPARATSDRFQPKHETYYYKKPAKHLYIPLSDNRDFNLQKPRQNYLTNRDTNKNKFYEFRYGGKGYPEIFFREYEDLPNRSRFRAAETMGDAVRDPSREKIRVRRAVGYSFEPAKGFFSSELEGLSFADFQKSNRAKIVHELESCLPGRKARESEGGENWAGKMTGWEFPRSEHEDSGFDTEGIFGLRESKTEVDRPLVFSGKDVPISKTKAEIKNAEEGKNWKGTSDKERLIQSYLNAPDYVLEEVETGLKGKRQTVGSNKKDFSRGGQNCEKEGSPKSGQDTAHCMRFGDLWYSVYLIKKPVIAQIVGIQMFDKHSLSDGSTQWRDLTKGKMVRIGTFLPKAEDELPTISMTYMGGKTKKVESAIDPDNYLLLIPSHVSDTSKASFYPQFEGGPAEYLVVDSKDVSSGGDCNMIGTSFEAFARQPDRCSQRKGSCLKRQPVDLWREDMEARIRGKRGKYFVENFGTVPNSPIKTFTNFTGEFLALEYYGEYTSTVEIEIKADYNAIIRKGSNAQIPSVYIDSTYPKKTRIILSVINIGLTSSYFRPRLGDCPPDLDPAWCPLEGPLVTIPPQQRHDFKLDLSGVLPPNKIHVTVQVLNQMNKKIAYRKIIIKKGDRCVCAFHCKCNCIGSLIDGRACHRLSLEDYRGAGYIGPFPFRGGAASSASESILGNIHFVFLTASYVLLFLGVAKGIIGIFFRRLGIAGTRVIVGPRKLNKYYEDELECCTVLCDDCGFPVHPTTCLPVQIVPLWLEVLINFLFFFLYPLRGIWFLLSSFPCCKTFCSDCDGCFRQDEDFDYDQKCSRPLLSKNPQPTCINYNLTTINTKKGKTEEYLPYLPYKGDDDPLEEDDTEFVLQEMKRYRKK